MPSNDDIGRQIGVVLEDDAEAFVTAGKSNEQLASDNDVMNVSDELDPSMQQKFTFFQKNKLSNTDNLTPVVAYASEMKVTELMARYDNAFLTNAKTQRHIAELMSLMSDVVRELSPVLLVSGRKTPRRSKWLFYGCLAVFGLGWFSLFPSGHIILNQILSFVVR